MRDYKLELEKRVDWIRELLRESGAKGVVYGNSGGKDSALAGILCRKACDNVLGVVMPCGSKQNYGADRQDALEVANAFDIPVTEVDLTAVREALLASLVKAEGEQAVSDPAKANINPRLRMTALYALAQTRGCLVCGTGNKDEVYMGYFTKWGDGAYDFNPIGDLTVTEIYEFLRFLGAPASVIEKAPSAGLFDGQTDEAEMGVTYAAIERYMQTGKGDPADLSKIQRAHNATAHKRAPQKVYGQER
ncbi:MAG: NAD(+) synthase [Clostridiales bacterium]|nr:NAD(+) synthase [Clostridiales bacterium]